MLWISWSALVIIMQCLVINALWILTKIFKVRKIHVKVAPCSLLPAPCSLLPAPYSLLPAPCSPPPVPCWWLWFGQCSWGRLRTGMLVWGEIRNLRNIRNIWNKRYVGNIHNKSRKLLGHPPTGMLVVFQQGGLHGANMRHVWNIRIVGNTRDLGNIANIECVWDVLRQGEMPVKYNI